MCDVLDIFVWVSNGLERTKAKAAPLNTYGCGGQYRSLEDSL